MTQEDKELLLKELAQRLPYGVMVYTDYDAIDCPLLLKELSYDGDYYAVGGDYTILRCIIFNNHPCKPYLRPMSNMTEEEDKEYAEVIVKSQDCSLENNESATTMANDWLLSKGFDVRGLISKGLALEAPKDMYKF